MKAGDTVYPIIQVTDAAGAAVTGLITADFTVTGYVGTATPVISFTVTEISAGRYRVNLTTNTTAGWQTYIIAPVGAYTVANGRWAGWVPQYRSDEIYAACVSPTASQSSATRLASDQLLEVIAYRYTPVQFSVVDSAGVAVDLSGFNNWRFNVWNKNHTVMSLYSQSATIVGTLGGVLTWQIPEDAAFFSQIAAAITAGEDQTTLYWEVIADAASTTTKTEMVLRGQLNLKRFEGPA